MELQSEISLNYNLSRKGQQERVLIDNFNDGVFVGRSKNESPEVDGEILIAPDRFHSEANSKEIIGTFVNVTIENADEYDLMAKFSKN
jgi:ribosomal protein S12 methylthiotransferase